MRQAGLDVNEVAGLVFQHALAADPELVSHPALKDVEHDVEIDVDVRFGYAAGRNGCDVHGKLCGTDILRRHADLVLDAVPITAIFITATTNTMNADIVFDSFRQVYFGCCHLNLIIISEDDQEAP